MRKDIQLSRICKNKDAETYDVEFKDMKNDIESAAKTITISFNTGAYHVLMRELDDAKENVILEE